MLRRFIVVLLTSTVFSGFGAISAMSADTEFNDFPDVPDDVRFEDTFRDAGFYGGARGGAVWTDDTQFTITGPNLVENSYDIGLAGSLFVGFEVPDLYHGIGMRLEGELGYAQADVDFHTVAGTPATAANSFGSIDTFTAMANVYADYTLGALRPFIGGGIGVARVDFEGHGVTGNLGVMNDTENGFAWQVAGGVAYDVTAAITVEAMVRYQEIQGVELVSSTGPTSTIDLSSTQVLLGARFSF